MNTEENYMTIEQAKSYLYDVHAIVEKEIVSYCASVRTYQERYAGRIVGEGIVMDVNFDNASGSYLDTRTIYYKVHRDRKVIVRYSSSIEQRFTDLPMHGTPQEAADYLLQDYREIFTGIIHHHH